mmetsp:Transcript_52625/g.151735  ORF Transcript_52625/g.151735 Transcript_52625/m.151735 type:complete len:276 (+) Transcript_52625:96-923(+)
MGGTLSHAWEEAFGEPVDLRILLVGPKGAGKKTVLRHLKLERKLTADAEEPGIQRAQKRRPWGNTRVTVCTIDNWATCLDKETFNALVLVVNLADVEGMEDLKASLERLLAENAVKGVPLLVVAHVEDNPVSLTAPGLADALGLNSIWDRHWSVKSMEGVSNDVLFEGMEWLASQQVASTASEHPPHRLAEPALDAVAREHFLSEERNGAPTAYRRYKTWAPRIANRSDSYVAAAAANAANAAFVVSRSRFRRYTSALLGRKPPHPVLSTSASLA